MQRKSMQIFFNRWLNYADRSIPTIFNQNSQLILFLAILYFKLFNNNRFMEKLKTWKKKKIQIEPSTKNPGHLFSILKKKLTVQNIKKFIEFHFKYISGQTF
jgi:hypothetical protein